MRILLLFLLTALCACSFRFDEAADEVEIRGLPGPLVDARVIHRGEYTREVALVRGASGAPFVLVRREGVAVSLQGPHPTSAVVDGQLSDEDGRIYRLEPNPNGAGIVVAVRRLGERGPGARFPFARSGRLQIGRDAFALWSDAAGCVDLVRFLPDTTARQRQVCGLAGSPFTFDPSGEVLFSRDAAGRVYAYHGEPPDRIAIGACLNYVPSFDSTKAMFQCLGRDGQLVLYRLRDRRLLPLGVVPEINVAGDVPGRRLLFFCSIFGVRVVSYADFSQRRLTARSCEVVIGHSEDGLLFRAQGDQVLYHLPLDGSASPRPVLDPKGAIVLSACADQVAYAPLGPGRIGDGEIRTSEGWLGADRFMDRGQDVSFGRGCRRLRWRGEPSYGDRLGVLLSSSLPLGKPLRLGIQSSWYGELPDGRVVGTTNMDGDGNLMLIDEERRQASPLVTGAEELIPMVLHVPELNSVLVQSWRMPKDYTLYLLPLPAP